jgi:hypothetical protein
LQNWSPSPPMNTSKQYYLVFLCKISKISHYLAML